MPKLEPLLGKSAAQRSSSHRIVATLEATIGFTLVAFVFWHVVHYLEDHVKGNPLMMGLYPFIGVASIVATLPFLMYITMAGEFGRLHPLHPRDYAFLLGRLGGAARSNNMKVSAKEL